MICPDCREEINAGYLCDLDDETEERLIQRIQEKVAKAESEGITVDGSNCTALAVQDLHEKEYAGNYDARYGAGAYARMKQRDAAWQQEAEERRKRREEERERMPGYGPRCEGSNLRKVESGWRNGRRAGQWGQ